MTLQMDVRRTDGWVEVSQYPHFSLEKRGDNYKFSGKIRFGISCESSARQKIHVKYQALFSLKKYIKTF